VTVASPCRAACRLNDDRRFCLSCGRNIKDIANWNRMSDEQKIKAKEEASKKLLDIA
jgi:predicted Fe-S protein YdhL (DUF1289 family)